MPLPLLLGLGTAFGALGQLIGGAIEAGKMGEASALLQQALDQYGPDILPKLKAELKNYGIPESQLAKVTGDAEAMAMQRRVLNELSQTAFAGPGDAQFSAELGRVQNQALANMGNQQARIQQQLAQQGHLGRVGVAAQQAAASQQANLMSQQGLDLAANAERRKMQALQSLGGLSSQMRGQSFQERSTAARAQDELNALNSKLAFDAQNQYYQQAQNEFLRKMALADSRSKLMMGQAGIRQQEGQAFGGLARGLAGSAVGFINDLGSYYGGEKWPQRQPRQRPQFYDEGSYYDGGGWA